MAVRFCPYCGSARLGFEQRNKSNDMRIRMTCGCLISVDIDNQDIVLEVYGGCGRSGQKVVT